MKRAVPVAIAIIAGVVVLLIYFLPLQSSALFTLRRWVFNWAALLATVALLVGVGNLLAKHANRLLDFGRGWLSSLMLLIGLLGMVLFYLPAFFVGLIRIAMPNSELLTTLGPGAAQFGGAVQFLFTYVQTPIEAALGGLLAFVLLLGGVRLLAAKRHVLGGVAFIGVAVVLLVFIYIWPTGYAWLTEVAALGGARGLLIGMALGAAATGLRVIFGMDQPYVE